MPDQYTCVHPIDHQPSYTDRQTADVLLEAKRRDRTAYEAACAHGRETGRIVEGVAPRPEQTPVRQPTLTETISDQTQPRHEASAVAFDRGTLNLPKPPPPFPDSVRPVVTRDRGAEPSGGD
jgi:hypothetical protein